MAEGDTQAVNLIHHGQESTAAGQERNVAFSCYTPCKGQKPKWSMSQRLWIPAQGCVIYQREGGWGVGENNPKYSFLLLVKRCCDPFIIWLTLLSQLNRGRRDEPWHKLCLPLPPLFFPEIPSPRGSRSDCLHGGAQRIRKFIPPVLEDKPQFSSLV